MAFWNAHTALLIVHALLPAPPLLQIAEWCDARGNDFDLAHERAEASKGCR
jgi:hypothetical protein